MYNRVDEGRLWGKMKDDDQFKDDDDFEGIENDQDEVDMLVEKMAKSSHWKTVELMPDDPDKVLTLKVQWHN